MKKNYYLIMPLLALTALGHAEPLKSFDKIIEEWEMQNDNKRRIKGAIIVNSRKRDDESKANIPTSINVFGKDPSLSALYDKISDFKLDIRNQESTKNALRASMMEVCNRLPDGERSFSKCGPKIIAHRQTFCGAAPLAMQGTCEEILKDAFQQAEGSSGKEASKESFFGKLKNKFGFS